MQWKPSRNLSNVFRRNGLAAPAYYELVANDLNNAQRFVDAITGRIKQLAERYATPLPKLTEELDILASRVDEHLKKMGFVWNWWLAIINPFNLSDSKGVTALQTTNRHRNKSEAFSLINQLAQRRTLYEF